MQGKRGLRPRLLHLVFLGLSWEAKCDVALTLLSCFLFIADQVYGDQDMHEVVRKHCMDYLVS